MPGGLVAASPLDRVSDWFHLGLFLSGLSVSGGTRRILAGSARDSVYANRGLPAATAARAVATIVITQFSLRVAFISYLGFLVLSCGFSFARGSRRFLARRSQFSPSGETRTPHRHACDYLVRSQSQFQIGWLGYLVLSCGLSFARGTRRFLAGSSRHATIAGAGLGATCAQPRGMAGWDPGVRRLATGF